MNKESSIYKARKNGGSYTITNILRLIGAIIVIGAGGYFFSHFKDIPTNEFQLYFNIILLIVSMGIGFALIGIAEIIFICTDIEDTVRRGLYKNILELKEEVGKQ